ncbi:UNVERIFIED_CONTAM: hypothetical protein Slati_0240200 [Sesamum latifolium]|uniref:DNA replication complex GINS protein PSF3 N-terminal domain-containing protein n=1 Tax=Sesamum latifolium TaxID=2727402 RepID=A0AAW2YCA7_9LAMI
MAKYYNIDDILAEEELVPSVFQHAANEVGLFDSSDDTNKVEAGSRVELPFWLVRELYLRQLISIRVPPCFDRESKTREEIGADAAHVDLRSRCLYFYEVGCKIAPLIQEMADGWAQIPNGSSSREEEEANLSGGSSHIWFVHLESPLNWYWHLGRLSQAQAFRCICAYGSVLLL